MKPEQVEINLSEQATEEAVKAEDTATQQEVKEGGISEAPATEKTSAQTSAKPAGEINSALAASGKGKRRASHPMALPVEVNDTFVDVALTAKSDEARPALVVSGKTAAIAKATSKASAPTTLPTSVDS